jgi:hypothetical protein
LYDVLQHASQIEYLTLDGFPHPNLLQCKPIELPNLVTLRLVRANRTLGGRIGLWSLPRLEHVIVEQMHRNESLVGLWVGHPQIRTIEQGQHLNFLIEDSLSSVMHWTLVTELAYRIFFTKVPENPVKCVKLEVIRWDTCPNMALEHPWLHALQHARLLQDTDLLPNLRRLVLHGDWYELLHNVDFCTALASLRTERQVRIELPDGRLVMT